MCGGFTCSKNALTALNIMYILVACLLISVAVYARASSQVTNLPIIGGILACGVFLIIISLAGLYGAAKHHQVVLFFYMIVLFLLFLIQFSIACACLAVNSDQQVELAKQGWSAMNDDSRSKVQENFNCCGVNGFNDTMLPTTDPLHAPRCYIAAKCCRNPKVPAPECDCPPCLETLMSTISYAFRLCGGIGLFFSFTEIVAVIVAYRYRNLYDPLDKIPAAHIPRNYLY